MSGLSDIITGSYWYNNRTNDTDWHPDGWFLTATRKELEDYLPTDLSAKPLYNIYIDHKGMTPQAALQYILELVTGSPHV